MNGLEIKTLFQTMVDDDTISDGDQTTLMNMAKNRVEGERDWEMTQALDETLSTVSGGTYLTPYDMPTSWLVPGKIYIGDNPNPCTVIKLSDRTKYKDSTNCIYFDFAAGHYFLTGSPAAGQVIHFNYTATTADIADDTSPIWPSTFHPLIAYRMAKLFYAIDAGDKVRSWDDRWSMYELELMESMIEWDTKLKLLSLNSGETINDSANIIS